MVQGTESIRLGEGRTVLTITVILMMTAKMNGSASGTGLSAHKMLVTVAGAGNCPITTIIYVISFIPQHEHP